LPLLALAEVDSAGGLLDKVAVLYRLAYLNPLQLRPYAHAHWSMPPAQLVQQRMRSVLGQQRTVVPAGEAVALARRPALRQSLPALSRPLELRLALEEFSQWFESPQESFGLLRLSVTLIEHAPAGARVLAQRQLVVRQPADTPDAAGGVRALSLATDAAGRDLLAWLARAEAAR
jgi:cholesterol transport system auxiliary component